MMTDESLIRTALDEWSEAFCTKNIDRMMALYSSNAVIYDAIPPFSSGVEALRTKVVDCFQYFPDGFDVEKHDLTVCIGSDMASAHFIWRFTGVPAGHPAGRHWLRSSVVWQRQTDGRWLITHDHCSAPFDPYTDKVVFNPDSSASASEASGACGERNPVGWFEIYVQDMERAKAFYRAVFGYAFTRLESPIELWAFPIQHSGGGASGALAKIDGCGPSGNNVIIYFSCEDCAVEADKAAAAGGKIHKRRFSIGLYGYIALVTDTEGNMIGLHSLK